MYCKQVYSFKLDTGALVNSLTHILQLGCNNLECTSQRLFHCEGKPLKASGKGSLACSYKGTQGNHLLPTERGIWGGQSPPAAGVFDSGYIRTPPLCIERMCIWHWGFNYHVGYVPGKKAGSENNEADYNSRHPEPLEDHESSRQAEFELRENLRETSWLPRNHHCQKQLPGKSSKNKHLWLGSHMRDIKVSQRPRSTYGMHPGVVSRIG